ncbi:hypothetical protein [Sphingomonas sp. VNH70]|uniref:hypothetical protein n=1 Tax=Sphingomonas silueang TaxID=3156617 RepID=UPI0032B50E9D
MRRADWALLGIAPTGDRGAIRRAYAARLKAMDVDADPDGFERLRAARDAALAHAAQVSTPVLADEDAGFAPEPEALPEPPAEPAIDPAEAAFHAAIEAHFRALESLLFPGHDAPPTRDELAAIAHHGQALLDDPRMEQVDFQSGAERWFAEHLAASIPRSDPLLEPAAAMFGWIDRRNDYALLPQAQAIVERIGATRFAALVGDPKHRLHRPWVELNRDDAARKPWWNPKGPRIELLSIIRKSHPQVEGWLNPLRVAEVEHGASGGMRVPVWLVIFAIVTVLRVFVGSGDSPSAPDAPVPAVLTSEPAAAPTPTTTDGKEAPQPTASATFSPVVVSIRNERISGLTNAPPAVIREITQWEVKVMDYYAPFDPAQCVDTTLWRPDARLSGVWQEQRRTLIERVEALASQAVQLTPSREFTVRGEIMRDLLKRTGFDQERLGRAFSSAGEIKDQCKAQVALRKAALAASPSEGTRLMRQLQLSVFG